MSEDTLGSVRALICGYLNEPDQTAARHCSDSVHDRIRRSRFGGDRPHHASLRALLGLGEVEESAASRAIVLDDGAPVAIVVDAIDALVTVEADRIASETAMNDSLLQKGDIVVTDRGFFVFRGVAADGYTFEFSPVPNPGSICRPGR